MVYDAGKVHVMRLFIILSLIVTVSVIALNQHSAVAWDYVESQAEETTESQTEDLFCSSPNNVFSALNVMSLGFSYRFTYQEPSLSIQTRPPKSLLNKS